MKHSKAALDKRSFASQLKEKTELFDQAMEVKAQYEELIAKLYNNKDVRSLIKEFLKHRNKKLAAEKTAKEQKSPTVAV